MAVAISEFRVQLQADVPECPVPRIDREIVNAVRTFCVDTHVIKKTLSATVTPVDETSFIMGSITVGTHTHLSGYDVIMPTYFVCDETRYGLWEYDPYLGTDGGSGSFPYTFPIIFGSHGSVEYGSLSDSSGPLYGMFFTLDQTTFSVFPLESVTDKEMQVTFAVKPERTVTTVADTMFYDHEEVVLNLARHYLFRIPRRAWTDLNLAQMYLSLYRNNIGDVRMARRMGGSNNVKSIIGGYF